ncbi:hypothetical protein [Pseudomonas sp. BMS12]|uniref:hypothetical protein n=1 Tax=Pseudomonas sp. BMS12 TaxID=1796033 RepID=UPI000A4A758D|nr:hypothetical protein [Pseudomonas sp. BMS12]
MANMSCFPDFLVGIRLAQRARYLFLTGCSVSVLALAVLLAAEFSARQPATVAMDVGLSVMRLLLPLVLVLMVQELLSREFDRRYFLSSLTYPRARKNLLIGRLLAVVVLVVGLLVAMALVLALLVEGVAQGYAQGTPVSLDYRYLITVGFVGADLLVLTALACLLAVVASTPSFVLIGTFGFMLVARSFAAIIALLGRDSWLVDNAQGYRSSLGVLGYLLPDLGALDVRMVALYGQMQFLPADWPGLLLSCLMYAVVLVAIAIWALQRKRFS